MNLPANPTARRREEHLLVQARLEAIDAQLDHLLTKGREVAQAASTPTAAIDPLDLQDLAEALAQDHSWLPHGSHVECTAVDTTSPLQRPYGLRSCWRLGW